MISSMKKYLLLLFAAASVLGASAQETGVSSPYSRYGVGVLSDPSLGFNKGMAGTGIALSDSRRLNFANPASYARFDSLSFMFDVGVTLQAEHRSAGNAYAQRLSRAVRLPRGRFPTGTAFGF